MVAKPTWFPKPFSGTVGLATPCRTEQYRIEQKERLLFIMIREQDRLTWLIQGLQISTVEYRYRLKMVERAREQDTI